MTPEEILLTRYVSVRSRSERLCAPLSAEDHVPQPVSDVSPPKWHLAHTTWFFETFVLALQQPGYRLFHPLYGYLFNSYYESEGAHLARPQRGSLSCKSACKTFQVSGVIGIQLFPPRVV